MRRLPSLTARLVVTTVALVVVVAVLIGGATSAALYSRLSDQMDAELLRSIAPTQPRTDGPGRGGTDGDDLPANPGGLPLQRNLRPGTLLAAFPSDDAADEGVILGQGRTDFTELSETALEELQEVPTDGEPHRVSVPDAGTFRVIAVETSFGVAVTGLPTEDVDEAVASLLATEALLIALGGLLAAGGAVVLIRRQLRPLTEVAATAHAVAALPLAVGEIDLAQRVPDRLTDERTEVGQVGAALNSLLTNVENSLEARQRSEQQVRQFVADASHELRTPLSTIAGYTELARRRPDPETTATALGKVEEESARMKALVEDLLLLARLDAGRPLAKEPVDLTRLLVEAVSDARVLGPEQHWRLDLPEEPIEVIGDDQRLHQVVTNLLANARKHTPAGTTVTVKGRPDGFDVADDGPGFPAEFVGHAFERFARGDASRNRAGGAGLGLSLVKAIVTSHGGTVSLHSAPGATRIEVRLGVRNPDPDAIP